MPTKVKGTTGVDKIESGAVITNPAFSGDATVSGSLTIAGETAATQNSLGVRNLIINGDMRIDQRNGGASITANDQTFVVDRFKFRTSQSSKMTAEQVTDVPAGQGFQYSTKITSSSAYTVLSTDFFNMQHLLEVQNIYHLMFGSSNAKTVTLSFWVKSSLTGSFAVSLNNVGASPSVYPAEYIINTANTWEKKTITVEGDTTGTYNTGVNSAGLGIIFNLGYGSNYEGTKNSWNASDANTFSGAVNLLETNGATLYITGVQLEVGTATPFEHRPYDMELQRCQRYYQTIARGLAVVGAGMAYTTTAAYYVVNFITPMRGTPVADMTGDFRYYRGGSSALTSTFSLLYATVSNARLSITGVSLIVGDGSWLQTDGGPLAMDAEL